MDISESALLAISNLTSVPVLAFLVGVLAAVFLRTELRLPDPVYKAISMYLLLAIGLKGGIALREAGISGVLVPAAVALALGCLIPVVAFHSLRFLTRLGRTDRGAMAAHYGSTSLVTFTAALTLLQTMGLETEGYVATLVVVMEIPGIIIGLLLAQRASTRSRTRVLVGTGGGPSEDTQEADEAQETAPSWGPALREIVTGMSVSLMVGGLLIGYLAGPSGYEAVSFVFTEMFTGVLALFLLHLGAVAGVRMSDVRRAGAGLVAFGLVFPIVAGTAGVLAATAIGMNVGGAVILGVLCASASYIAAPAAVGLVLPEANEGVCLTSSLAITFPFNLVIGIPLLVALARLVAP